MYKRRSRYMDGARINLQIRELWREWEVKDHVWTTSIESAHCCWIRNECYTLSRSPIHYQDSSVVCWRLLLSTTLLKCSMQIPGLVVCGVGQRARTLAKVSTYLQFNVGQFHNMHHFQIDAKPILVQRMLLWLVPLMYSSVLFRRRSSSHQRTSPV